MGDNTAVPAHTQAESHRPYLVHFPPHPARKSDPHYVDFSHFHRMHRKTARCYVGLRVGFGDCRDAQGNPSVIDKAGQQSGLELHHAHIEFALQQGVDLAALEVDYPGVSNPDEIGAWVESATNLRWLCVHHHRGPAGSHSIVHADWEAQQYIFGLITPKETTTQ